MLHKEVAKLCSDDLNSVMKQKDVNFYKNSDKIIEQITGEIESLAAILLFLLQSCLKNKEAKNQHKRVSCSNCFYFMQAPCINQKFACYKIYSLLSCV